MLSILKKIYRKVISFINYGKEKILLSRLGGHHKSSHLYPPANLYGNPRNIFLEEKSHIYGHFTFISVNGKFIMRKNSGAAQGLTVITDNHVRRVGHYFIDGPITNDNSTYKDIIVDDDVWIGANVTLCDGCHIHRGAVIGAGSTVRTNVPPYAIVFGNPAKIIGFVFNPSELEEHEKLLYSEDERISLEKYKKDFDKYYVKRVKEISSFCRL